MKVRTINRRCPQCGSYVTAAWGKGWIEYECCGPTRHRRTVWGSDVGGEGSALEEVFDIEMRRAAGEGL